MGEFLNERLPPKRNSRPAMLSVIVVFCLTSRVVAQDGAAVSTSPPQQVPLPFMDLLPGSSNYVYSDAFRKSYSDPSPSYHVSCPKTDSLGSFASILGSAAKIMLAVAGIVLLKVVGGKMLLIPVTTLLIAKIGLKAILLWPTISKMIKFFKKKKKKAMSRNIKDCTQRLACIVQKSIRDGWGSNFGTALTFTFLEDVENETDFTKIILEMFAGEHVSKCMEIECSSGFEIS